MQINQFLRRVSIGIPIALVALLLASPKGAQADYYWMNSVTPSYIEASTRFPLSGDDSYRQVSLPFPFTFYGDAYSQAWVSTNGYINFLGGNSEFKNGCLPSIGIPNGAIYPFWDDLNVDSAASMWTEERGTDPNRQFVIEWRNVTFFGESSRRLSFEIVLSQTGEITFQYKDIAADSFRERGNSATIGVETTNGASAYQFSCGGPTIGWNDGPGGLQDWPLTVDPVTGTSFFAIQFYHAPLVDIKPGSCTNPFNVGSKGVLPVAILGTTGFDVTTIDPATVKLAGVSALRSSIEDVGTPGRCDLGPDGHMDLTLKFDSEAVSAALGTVNDGEVLVLKVEWKLKGGTDISDGEDVVTIIKKK